MHMFMSRRVMRTERLTILVTREQKRELVGLAKQRRISVGELVRAAVAAATRSVVTPKSDEVEPTAEQTEALERAAEAASGSLKRAADALGRAETELARTRAHFDAKPGENRDADATPRALLQRMSNEVADLAVDLREIDRRVAQLEGAFAVVLTGKELPKPPSPR
jgi:hypothetical protein